jgi:hypothetical protein
MARSSHRSVSYRLRVTVLFVCAALFAGCSGGGGGNSPSPHVTPTPGGATPTPGGPTPTPAPSSHASPTATPSGPVVTPTPGPPASALPTAAYVFGNLTLSSTAGEIDIFPKGSVGTVTPTRLTSTALAILGGILAVAPNGTVVGSGACPPCMYTLVEFSASAIGLNATPTAVINYPGHADSSPLISPGALAFDKNGFLYAIQTAESALAEPASIFIINPGASGSLSGQYQTIAGSATMLNSVNMSGLAVDAAGNIYAALEPMSAAPYIAVFPPGQFGNVAPSRVITGSNTGFKIPGQIGVSAGGTLYVFDTQSQEVFVFAPGANGNVLPTAEFQSPQLPNTSPMAVDASGNVFTFDLNFSGPQSLIVFDVGASGFVSPAFSVALPAYLSGNSGGPSGIAVAPP